LTAGTLLGILQSCWSPSEKNVLSLSNLQSNLVAFHASVNWLLRWRQESVPPFGDPWIDGMSSNAIVGIRASRRRRMACAAKIANETNMEDSTEAI
jgi:hypothetical protein